MLPLRSMGHCAALPGAKAMIPEDALTEREKRLRGDGDSLDNVDDILVENGNAPDVEAGQTEVTTCGAGGLFAAWCLHGCEQSTSFSSLYAPGWAC